MKKLLLIIAFFLINTGFAFANCELTTDAPILTLSGENEMKIKFKTTGNCADTTNEFKIYYLKDGNYSKISSLMPGENKQFYDVKWDISNIPDGEYKIKVLQDGDVKTSVSTAFFTIDKTKPEIRDDFWVFPTGGEILKGNVVLKWNIDSVSDSYKLDDNPVSIYYSFNGGEFTKIVENIENSGIYVWNTKKEGEEINSKNVYLKVVAKDLYGNENFLVSEKSFEIDNNPPKKLNFVKVGDENFSDKNFILNFTPKVKITGFNEIDGEVRVSIFDDKTDKIYGNGSASNGELSIQLDPLDDENYDFKILSIDKAGNRSISDETLKITRDSIPPKAPKISYAAIIKNTLRVSVEDFDTESGTFILMNGAKILKKQDTSKNIFNVEMVPQGVYDLYVKQKDLAGNLSDSSNVKKVIYDTVAPLEVNFSIPLVALEGSIPLNFFAVDNVGVEKIEVYVDGEKIGEAKDLKFNLNTENFSNGYHKIYAVAKDFNGNEKKSEEKNFRVFNPLKKNHWANNYIKNLYNKNILKGENNSGIIDPDAFLNRAKALKIISEFFADKIKDIGDKKINFADVSSGVWYEKYVQDGYKNHIISGNKKSGYLQKISENLAKTRSKEEIENGQMILKSLGFNLKITGVYDAETRRAIANYQKRNGLKASGLVGVDTIRFLNFEPNVVNGIFYEDDDLYFFPGKMINRAEVLKMILQAAKVKLEDKGGPWYQKYLDFAVKNGIMSGKENGDFALGDPVTVGEMAKMILKTGDVLRK
ncbi:S-layer homology domain-containing protein [Candidatus Gracilibacteria bacterium]|nr:S-layer homology domain-containing protein [Candidatus Gracilibacteria bacterium]